MYICMFVLSICLHAVETADVSTLSSYGSRETKSKRCGSYTPMTKRVTQTNYYDTDLGTKTLACPDSKACRCKGIRTRV